MNTILIHSLITVYLVANGFITGYYFSDYHMGINFKDIVISILFLFVGFLFGLFALLVPCIYYAVKAMYEWSQISFFCRFYFTNHYHNLKEDHLRQMHHLVTDHRNTNSISDRILRLAVKMVYKRNNYTYKPLEPNF